MHFLDHIFVQAVRLSEVIGIFQWHHLEGQLSESDLLDYKNIAHCLYILDKRICWTAGVPPRLQECQVQLDITPLNNSFKTLAVKAELAAIEESIYLQIYAGHAKVLTEDEVRDTVGAISQRLDNWLVKAGVDVEATSRQPETFPSHAAFLFGALCAKLLLLTPFKDHPDHLFQQHHGIATNCLRLLRSLWASTLGAWQQVSVPLYVSPISSKPYLLLTAPQPYCILPTNLPLGDMLQYSG